MSNPIVQAQHLAKYENQSSNIRALIALAADGTGTNSLSNNVGYWNASGTFTTIFTPSAGASDPRMLTSRDYAFFLDHVLSDQKKWNLSFGPSKWGIDAPLTAPTVSAIGTTTDSWSASTTFTTFGLLVDANNNVQQLQTVNADGTNPSSHVGTSSVGSPNWNQTPGGTTLDSTVTWLNRGAIGIWKANTLFNNGHPSFQTFGTTGHPCVIYDPGTNALYINHNASGNNGTSGSVRPSFTGVNGSFLADNGGDNGVGVAWRCISPNPGIWINSHSYLQYLAGQSTQTNRMVVEPTQVTAAFNTTTGDFSQKVFLQTVNVAGTSAASGTTPQGWSTDVGGLTEDGQLRWQNQGSKTRLSNTAYTQWTGAGIPFSAIFDGVNLQVCMISGTSGSVAPTFGTTYGDQTQDGTVTWVCMKNSLSWASSTKWYKSPGGFTIPTSTGSYGGASILDSNNNIETVVASGLSGAAAPVWGAINANTTDNGITWFNVGANPAGGGSVALLLGRRYFLIFGNPVSGNFSGLSPVSVSTGPLTSGSIFLSQLAVSSDPQVTSKTILATLDGGNQTTLFKLTSIPNAALTFTDTTTDLILGAQPVFLGTDSSGVEHGVADNTPPPNGSFPTKHRGRIYMTVGPTLFFSKSLAELTTSSGLIAGRYEECWPSDFQMDISSSAETANGLFSDGVVLYIGTQRAIRKVLGDGPTNFSSPEIVFNEVGLLNQDVWQAIFLEGTPAGTMWLTPDFRCIRSDFNTYKNVGEPIQTTLNSINPAGAQNCWATYVGEGDYNFYVLAIPTGTGIIPDTLCIYNIATGGWFIWTPADRLRFGIYYLNLAGIPRWVVNALDGSIYLFDPKMVMDRQTGADRVGITSTIRTVFNDLTDASTRKALNEIEVATTQPNLTVTVEGASTANQFLVPNLVVGGSALTTNLFGDKKLYLVGLPSFDRFYRLTFSDTSLPTSTVDDVLISYYSIEAIPLHRN